MKSTIKNIYPLQKSTDTIDKDVYKYKYKYWAINIDYNFVHRLKIKILLTENSNTDN